MSADKSGVNEEALGASMPIGTEIARVRDGQTSIDWPVLIEAVKRAISLGCATEKDLNEVEGHGLSVDRMKEIWSCLDAKGRGGEPRVFGEPFKKKTGVRMFLPDP